MGGTSQWFRFSWQVVYLLLNSVLFLPHFLGSLTGAQVRLSCCLVWIVWLRSEKEAVASFSRLLGCQAPCSRAPCSLLSSRGAEGARKHLDTCVPRGFFVGRRDSLCTSPSAVRLPRAEALKGIFTKLSPGEIGCHQSHACFWWAVGTVQRHSLGVSQQLLFFLLRQQSLLLTTSHFSHNLLIGIIQISALKTNGINIF